MRSRCSGFDPNSTTSTCYEFVGQQVVQQVDKEFIVYRKSTTDRRWWNSGLYTYSCTVDL